ncbi:MAG: outer membrane lipoprotein-sorting protein [Alcanivoracaceae bacterium]|nr:outer membrane lipoprotein-sorting protein [Alcanivoracaceae bacterium]
MQTFTLLGIRYPKTTLLIGLLCLGLLASGLSKVFKDTRADAFLSSDNPALIYKNKARKIFGISDPLVIAIEHQGADGIYTDDVLALVSSLTDAVNSLPNVNEDRTMSLSTENNIVGNSAGMDVSPFMDLLEDGGPSAVRNAIQNFPLYNGLMVSEDGAMTLIIAELYDDSKAEATYQSLETLVASQKLPAATMVYTAGEGAVLGYLGHYIDRDASRLNPLAGLIITIILIIAFRRFAPALLGNLVIAASVLMTVGFMGYSGVPFYVITNAMPVILIGMAVADSIHIFSHYYELLAKHPDYTPKQAIEEAVTTMAGPVTLTTITTMAGFIGLYASADMPPFEYFGLFTTFGVLIAWFYSLLVLPAAITLMKPKVSQRWVALQRTSGRDVFARTMMLLGTASTRHAKATVSAFSLLALAGLVLSLQLRVNDDRIETFHHDEPIYQADKAINAHMHGSNTLDVVIETDAAEGLFDPRVLAEIEALQAYGKTLPHVNGSMSLVDYLKQMNKSLNEDQQAFYALPENKELAAQYLLLYSASSDPTDFDNVVDYDYRLANVRFYLDSADYSETSPVVQSLESYVQSHFGDSGATATITGRVNLNYHWLRDIGRSHFVSVGISLICVLAVSMLLFRSWVAGVFAVLPVITSILMVYATMVLFSIDLGIGTSMFASVAIGLGIDFAIHTIDRLKSLFKDNVPSAQDLVTHLYASTGRALLFNYLAVACGFGVLIISKVVPLNNFGTIVVLSVTMSFIASLALLPALVLVFKPAFLYRQHNTEARSPRRVASVNTLGLALVIGLAATAAPKSSYAKELPDGDTIVSQINQVDEGEHAISQMHMTLTDKSGKARERSAISYRKYFGKEKRTLLFYLSPTNVKDTGFLTYDYPNNDVEDDQWLYLPALRKVRRISASDRGDYFLGTDFTYEDIKKAGKIEQSDFDFHAVAEEMLSVEGGSITTYKVSATTKTPEIAEELGYQRMAFWVNPENWIVLKTEYWDLKDRHLKTYTASDISKVDGLWTKHRLEVKNHKTGHDSLFEFSDVDYQTPVQDDLFTRRTLERGL